MVLARQGILATPGAAAETAIVAPWPTIATIIVAARRALRLRLW